MSGGASLGLRSSGNYGSLQQQPACQSPAPSPSPPLAPRKPAKMSLGGAGRGLLCARICKLVGRRQRMLLLLVAVAVAVCFVFSSLVVRAPGSKDRATSANRPIGQSASKVSLSSLC